MNHEQINLTFANGLTLAPDVVFSQNFRMGGDNKRRITVQFVNGVYINMIIRGLSLQNISNKNQIDGRNVSDIYLEKWKYLKKIGLPVPSFMAKVSDTEVATLDLSESGKNMFYGKIEHEMIDQGEILSGQLVCTERHDRMLSRLNLQEFYQSVDKIVAVASKNNVLLPNDDPFSLLVHENGKYKVMLIDFGDARLPTDHLLSQIETETFNINMGTLFKSYITRIYTHINNGVHQ